MHGASFPCATLTNFMNKRCIHKRNNSEPGVRINVSTWHADNEQYKLHMHVAMCNRCTKISCSRTWLIDVETNVHVCATSICTTEQPVACSVRAGCRGFLLSYRSGRHAHEEMTALRASNTGTQLARPSNTLLQHTYVCTLPRCM